MASRHTWLVVAVLSLAGRVAAEPCTPEVRASGEDQAWKRAIDAVRGELASRGDIERCAAIEVRVEPRGQDTEVTVVIDGRRAVRMVADPADMRTTLLSLLLEPELGRDGGTAEVPTPEPASTAPPIAETSTPQYVPLTLGLEAETRVVVPAPARASIAIDASLAMGASWSGGAVQPTAAAMLRETRQAWSIDVFGRLVLAEMSHTTQSTSSTGNSVPGSGMPSGRPATSSRELGAELGHRFELRPVAVTVSAGPTLVLLRQAAPMGLQTASVVRAGAAVRVETRSMRHLGVYLSLDGAVDVGQLDSSSSAAGATSALPTWSVGAALGGELRAWP